MIPFAFGEELMYVDSDENPDDIAGRFLMDVIGFLFILSLSVWPPDPLVHSGLVIENLPRPNGLGGSLLGNLEIKIYFNRLYLALLPVLFSLYAMVTYGPMTYLLIFFGLSLATFQYQIINAIIGCYNLALGKTRLLSGFSQEEITEINNMGNCFNLPLSFSSIVAINDRYLVRVSRFWYSVKRMDDLKFTVIDSKLSREGADHLSILIEDSKSGKGFNIKIHSANLPDLRGFVTVEMKCKGIYERFIERFSGYINDNPKFVMNDTDSLDPCFACYAKKPNVVIKKSCTSGPCSSCDCRPTWCVECLARIFAAAQPAERPATWMDGTASCPTCRATFCANDVLFVINETDL